MGCSLWGHKELDTAEQLTQSERSVVLIERLPPWDLRIMLYPVPAHMSCLPPVP